MLYFCGKPPSTTRLGLQRSTVQASKSSISTRHSASGKGGGAFCMPMSSSFSVLNLSGAFTAKCTFSRRGVRLHVLGQLLFSASARICFNPAGLVTRGRPAIARSHVCPQLLSAPGVVKYCKTLRANRSSSVQGLALALEPLQLRVVLTRSVVLLEAISVATRCAPL
jgi:hypothetical protein